MTAILTGIVWLMTLAEAFRFGYLMGRGKKNTAAPEISEKEKREAERAERAERELNNMLTYDGSEQ